MHFRPAGSDGRRLPLSGSVCPLPLPAQTLADGSGCRHEGLAEFGEALHLDATDGAGHGQGCDDLVVAIADRGGYGADAGLVLLIVTGVAQPADLLQLRAQLRGVADGPRWRMTSPGTRRSVMTMARLAARTCSPLSQRGPWIQALPSASATCTCTTATSGASGLSTRQSSPVKGSTISA